MLDTLHKRFDANNNLHAELRWEYVEKRLITYPFWTGGTYDKR